MANYVPGLIMGFREGLEAFLIISIIIRYLDKIKQDSFKKNVFAGAGVGVAVSLVVGGVLYFLSKIIEESDKFETMWASLSSFVALGLVTTFIIWMIKNGSNMAKQVQNKAAVNLSRVGLVAVSAVMIGREGVEIAIFSFAGGYNAIGTIVGIVLALGLALLLYFSLIKVKISTIFNVTLIYLIFQAGYLLGFAIHDGIESLGSLNIIGENSIFSIVAFDLSGTPLNNETGIIGFPLYVLFGWISNPFWTQLFAQVGYVISIILFMLFKKTKHK
ncbi:MAG: FTR1 family protein [Bacillota bacterium]